VAGDQPSPRLRPGKRVTRSQVRHPTTGNAQLPRTTWKQSNEIVTIRKAKPIPLRRTKSCILLSDACLLWSNEL
jgi:hypothetical protein